MAEARECEALVLSQTPRGKDLIVRVLTQTGEPWVLIARSAARPGGPLPVRLSPPVVGGLRFVESRGGARLLIGFEPHRRFPGLASSLTRALTADALLSLLTALPQGVELGGKLFRLAVELLEGLSGGGLHPAQALARLIWHLLDEMGRTAADPAGARMLIVDLHDGRIFAPSPDYREEGLYPFLEGEPVRELARALAGRPPHSPAALCEALELIIPAVEAALDRELPGLTLALERICQSEEG